MKRYPAYRTCADVFIMPLVLSLSVSLPLQLLRAVLWCNQALQTDRLTFHPINKWNVYSLTYPALANGETMGNRCEQIHLFGCGNSHTVQRWSVCMGLEWEAVNWGCLNVVAKLIPDATCQQRPRDQPIQLMNIYEKCSTDGGGGGALTMDTAARPMNLSLMQCLRRDICIYTSTATKKKV